MANKKSSNFVDAIAAEFGPNLTDFSRAGDWPHPTVVNWSRANAIPVWRDAEIMAAAKKAKLGPKAKARIRALLKKR